MTTSWDLTLRAAGDDSSGDDYDIMDVEVDDGQGTTWLPRL